MTSTPTHPGDQPPWSPDDRPSRAPSVQAHDLPDGVALFDPRSEVAHHLNPVATLVWELVDGRTVADIRLAVALALEVDDAEASRVTHSGLSQLAQVRALA